MNWLIAAVLFGVDRLLKYLFYTGAVINKDYVGGSVLTVIISIMLVYLLKKRFEISGSTKWDVFVISGGVSNLLDIIVFGGVVDFITLFSFRLNSSDILITIGLILLIIQIWKQKS